MMKRVLHHERKVRVKRTHGMCHITQQIKYYLVSLFVLHVYMVHLFCVDGQTNKSGNSRLFQAPTQAFLVDSEGGQYSNYEVTDVLNICFIITLNHYILIMNPDKFCVRTAVQKNID